MMESIFNWLVLYNAAPFIVLKKILDPIGEYVRTTNFTLPSEVGGVIAVCIAIFGLWLVPYIIVSYYGVLGKALEEIKKSPQVPQKEPYYKISIIDMVVGSLFFGDVGMLLGVRKNPKYKGDDIKFI